VGALLIVAVIAYSLVPVLPGHAPLKAHGPAEWWSSFHIVLGWPLKRHSWAALVMWQPSVLFTARLVQTRRVKQGDLFGFGLAVWVILQAAAMAYSRGHAMTEPTSRYRDILAIGMVVNLWFALTWVTTFTERSPLRLGQVARMIPVSALLLFMGGAGVGLGYRTPIDFMDALHYLRLSNLQTGRVRGFLREGSSEFLDAVPPEIPYPSRTRLEMLLMDPTLRRVLPSTVRAPLLPRSRDEERAGPPGTLYCSGANCGAFDGRPRPAEWTSAPITAALPAIDLPFFASGDHVLDVVAPTGPVPWDALRRPEDVPMLVRLPRAEFRLAAKGGQQDGALVVGSPREVGPLSFHARRLGARVRRALPARWFARCVPGAAIDLPLGTSPTIQVQISRAHPLRGSFRAPSSGVLLSVETLVGTYAGQADGRLVLDLCSVSACSRASAELEGASNNADLVLRLTEPLPMNRGEMVHFSFSQEHAKRHDVALWTGRPRANPGQRAEGPTSAAPGALLPRLLLRFFD
jgi:hypothetical protein